MAAYALYFSNKEDGPQSGELIPRAEAIKMVKNYHLKNNPAGDETIFVGFSKTKFDELMDNNNANGIRIYLARKNGTETVICVLTQEDEAGVVSEIQFSSELYGLNFGTLCPPKGNFDCETNSLAKEVYGDLICPPVP